MSFFVKFAGFIGMTLGILSLVIVALVSIGAISTTGGVLPIDATAEQWVTFGLAGSIVCILGGRILISLGDWFA